MKVSDCMTRDVKVIAPDTTIREAARIMARNDLGALPVGDNDRLVGMVTDRDIVVRALSDGKGPDTPVREVMSEGICYCFEDEDLNHVADNMGDQQLRRLPVMSRSKRLVGIVSLGDMAHGKAQRQVGVALGAITKDGGRHTQEADARH
jgi:CBS domain-containing protein